MEDSTGGSQILAIGAQVAILRKRGLKKVIERRGVWLTLGIGGRDCKILHAGGANSKRPHDQRRG